MNEEMSNKKILYYKRSYNETAWHRGWKEKFQEHFRKFVHSCEVSGGKHRADIKSDNGIIIEIQKLPNQSKGIDCCLSNLSSCGD